MNRRAIRQHRFSAPPLLALLAVLSTSCSGELEEGRWATFPVHGQIFVQGAAAERALVVFHPLESSEAKASEAKAPHPHGRVQADGSFQLGTYEASDGAPAGAYAVTVLWPESPKSPLEDPDMGPDRLKGRYSNPQRSGLRVRVVQGENRLEPFQLD